MSRNYFTTFTDGTTSYIEGGVHYLSETRTKIEAKGITYLFTNVNIKGIKITECKTEEST